MVELRYIGVDPGKTGAIAALDAQGVPLCLIDIPYLGKDIDVQRLDIEIGNITQGVPAHAAIERQQVFPQQGAVSGFTIGYGYGMLVGLFLGLGISFETPRPAKWKHDMGLTDDKDASIQMARRLFPTAELVKPRARTPSNDRAEALLLAEWVRRLR